MRTDVTLRPLDPDLLDALLRTAVADADPREVMPPVPGSTGWTAGAREAFLRFHRSRSLSAEPVEATFAVLVGPEVAGAARLCPAAAPAGPAAASGRTVEAGRTAEAGVWIGRGHRGPGWAGPCCGSSSTAHGPTASRRCSSARARTTPPSTA